MQKLITAAALFCLYANIAFSDNIKPDNNIEHRFSYLMFLSGGPVWASAGRTQTLTLQPNYQDTYVANRHTNTLGTGAVFAGITTELNSSLQEDLGIAFTGSGKVNLSGDTYQDADPNFNNFNYNYNVSQFRIGLLGRLVMQKLNIIANIAPYLSGEAGIGFNHSYNYKSNRKIDTAVLEPSFVANTTYAFSYALGIGLQKQLSNNVSLGLGYEFADWGRTALSPAKTQVTSQAPSLSNLYTNEMKFTVFYKM